MSGPLVGLIDSGVDPARADRVEIAAGFRLDASGTVARQTASPDRLGHGDALAGTLLTAAPAARLAVAQVFQERLTTTPAQIAAALDWLVGEGAALVTMSFGLRADRDVLRAACGRALAAGAVLVAATPARGGPVFPAALPGVLRATGDARCAPGELAWLSGAPDAVPGSFPGGTGPEVAGCVASPCGRVRGASAGCAWVAGALAAHLAEGGRADPDALRGWLRAAAHHHGPERRGTGQQAQPPFPESE